MFRILLYEPEIAPNTGNVIRLCANTGAELHLIEPLGFELDDARLRRAGLDYREWVNVRTHRSLEACIDELAAPLYAFSSHGETPYTDARFTAGDLLLFGPETRGLPQAVVSGLSPSRILRMPMVSESRSLNLSNAVAVALFEAWRQLGFAGARP